MMSDHWKAIARLLGAAGAADATPSPSQTEAKTEASKSAEPAKRSATSNDITDVAPGFAVETGLDSSRSKDNEGSSVSAGGRQTGPADSKNVPTSSTGKRGSGFGAGLIADVEDDDQPAVAAKLPEAKRTSRAEPTKSEGFQSESVKHGSANAGTGSSKADFGGADRTTKDDDLLGFSSFRDLDEEREKPARELFGRPKESQARGPEGKSAAKKDLEAPRVESGRESSDLFGDSTREESRDARGFKGLDRLFGESDEANEPSTWDKLVDRLGVEEPKDRREARKNSPEATRRPSESDAKKPKGERGGFGSGLGLDFEEDTDEPIAPKDEAVREKGEPRASRPPRKEDAWKPEEDKDTSLEALDPLAELGGEGWGRPRNKGRGRGSIEPSRLDHEDRPAKPKAEASFADPFDDDADAGSANAGDAELTEPRSRRGQSSRHERGTSSEGRGGRSDQRGGGGSDRAPREETRREERPARSFAADQGERESEREHVSRDAADSEEVGGRGGRRGRRRGQRQRMGEEQTQAPENRNVKRTSQPVDDLFDFDDVSDDPMDGTLGFATVDDLEASDTEGDSGSRKRRRRGRRRRGGGEGSSERSVPERAPEDRVVESGGRAIDAEFDDDHEDDEEAVVLRRSRRRRRRRGGSEVEGSRTDADEATEIEEIGSVDSVVYDPVDPDDEVAAYNTQRNVPTWLDAVDILVNSNIDTRKRDTKRPSGGGNGGGGGGNGGGGGRNRPRR